MKKKRGKKTISDEEIERSHRLLLEQVGEAAGLPVEEMEKRLEDLIKRSSIKGKEVEEAAIKALDKVRRKQQFKVTVALNRDLEQKFMFLKKKFNAKSNSQLLRNLIIETYQHMIDSDRDS